MRRKRVVFFGEAVTLAHAGRAAVLSRTLDSRKYQTWLATSPRYREILGAAQHFVPLQCMENDVFRERLAAGKPVFQVGELAKSVEDDLRILEDIKPDVVVGDFRVSLSVSARTLGIPYVAISDSYWSPYAKRRFPLPDLPIRRLGNWVSERLFEMTREFAFFLHTRPINVIRRRYGLPSVGGDLCVAYSDADYVVYPDLPELLEKPNLPPNHHHIGHVMFEPDVPLPSWWDAAVERPNVYVSLGTSGRADVLPMIFAALGSLPINLLVASAGCERSCVIPPGLRANVFLEKYLPGHAAAARSSLVICNGGSGATHQALRAGAPVLGIASNMDQLMNMAPIEAHGAGLTLGTWDASAESIRDRVRRLLEESAFRDSARKLGALYERTEPEEKFPLFIEQVLSGSCCGVESGYADHHARRDHVATR